MNVVLIGASNKPDRYSYMALKRLLDAGYDVFPVHKIHKNIDGIKVYSSIKDIKVPIDTVTLYINSVVSSSMSDDIISANPRRIIFNPGAENHELQELAQSKGIETVFACTLVMLSTGSF
jgi:uncharacterized protein